MKLPQLKEIVRELVRETWPDYEDLQDEVYVENKMKVLEFRKIIKEEIKKFNEESTLGKLEIKEGFLFYNH